MRESAVERKIGAFAKKHGCLFLKFVSPNRRGVPDRLIVSPKGKVMFLEIKAPGKTPTALQKREISLLNEYRVPAFWTDSVIQGESLIEDFLLK